MGSDYVQAVAFAVADEVDAERVQEPFGFGVVVAMTVGLVTEEVLFVGVQCERGGFYAIGHAGLQSVA
ncbi:hypothetical protein [Actinomadura nitritigenes]|uniref:hypothetical protein n=1 Tax=Actinomadura nitritigenes TaxID=134602 RepID=UPI001AAFAFD4|nr:hypothetical protein [Actinomadura nitritigenes]